MTYIVKDQTGDIIKQNDMPVSYVHGVGSDLIPALEKALAGHAINDRVHVTIFPQDAFGEYDTALVFTDSLENVPEEFRYVGAQAQFQNDEGESKTFIVTKIENDRLTLDGNHPFAGKTVEFEATIHSIRDASDDEIANKVSMQAYAIDIMDTVTGAPL